MRKLSFPGLTYGIWPDVFLPFFLSRLAIFATGQLALAWGALLPNTMAASGRPWIDMWARWDSGWYLSITSGGYEFAPDQPSNAAFFPLYPLVIRLLSFGSRDMDVLIIVGWLIANTATLVAFYLLYRLVLLDDSSAIGRRVVWLLAFFPTSFFMGVVYTEAVFLFLTVAAFYAARKRRWLAAGLSGGLGAATKIIGIFLILPLAWEWYQQKPRRWLKSLPLLLIPLGLGAFMLYLSRNFGDPLAFSDAHSHWGRSVSPLALFEALNSLVTDPGPFLRGRGVTIYEALFVLLALGLLVVVVRKQRLSYTLYAAYSIAIPLASINTMSFSRLMVVIFPLFIAMAQVLTRPLLFRLVLIAMAILQLILVVRWTLGYWVA
jgi:hypothetical protein